MLRSRISCGWLSGASARFGAACCSSWLYCWVAAASICSAETSFDSADGLPTSTPSRASAGRPARGERRQRRPSRRRAGGEQAHA